MIRVSVVLDAEGVPRWIEANGHAGFATGGLGENIVCAAATALVRSAATELARAGCARVASGGEGHLAIEIAEAGDLRWLRGVTDVLVGGIETLAREYPRDVRLELTGPEHDTAKEGTSNGT